MYVLKYIIFVEEFKTWAYTTILKRNTEFLNLL